MCYVIKDSASADDSVQNQFKNSNESVQDEELNSGGSERQCEISSVLPGICN